ncbi:MAG: CotH kinase family protein, partial [Verrucomicrobiales bacterium]
TYTEPIVLTETVNLAASISRGPLRREVFFSITPELAAQTSNLPLVLVESDGTIGGTNDEMVLGILELSGEDGRTKFEGEFTLSSGGQIRTRGSSTQSFPKKSYRVEFQDEDGEDKVEKPLGMPAESDWILSGRYEEDRSLVRNEFTYALSRQIGRYAARTHYCEVYVSDGEGPVDVDDYVGVYSFMEAMKRDADRIDIDGLTEEDNEEPEVTGGYIFKVDRSGPNDTSTNGGGQGIVLTEPSKDALTSEQLAYLRGYLDDMADSFDSSDPETGYPAFINVPSWVDHHMINMLMLNVDSLRLSTFFYKERNGKVFGGPVWDFNIAAGSRDRFGSPPRPRDPDVWRGISGDRGTTFFTNGTQRWWGDLFEDRDFQQAYCDRWNELREGAFSNENLEALIDRLAGEIGEAQPRNQARWPEVSPEYGGWQGELDHLKDWLTTRGDWVDDELV